MDFTHAPIQNNTNPAEIFTMLELLPTDLKQQIVMFLDIPTLQATGLLNKQWANFAATISKQCLDKYFPYLKTTCLNAYNNTPLALFIKEYQRYNQKIPSYTGNHQSYINIGMLILEALRGNKDCIEEQKDIINFNHPEQKSCTDLYDILCAYAIANGHYHFLNGQTSETAGAALIYAAQNGQIDAVKHLLTSKEIAISTDHKYQALISCYHVRPQLNIFKILLNIIGSEVLATPAAREKMLLDIKKFLHNDSNATKAFLSWHFQCSAQNGDFNSVLSLIKQDNKMLSSNDKGAALCLATQNGHKKIVSLLLNFIGKDILIEDKQKALNIAKACINPDIKIMNMLTKSVTPPPPFIPMRKRLRDRTNSIEPTQEPEKKKQKTQNNKMTS